MMITKPRLFGPLSSSLCRTQSLINLSFSSRVFDSLRWGKIQTKPSRAMYDSALWRSKGHTLCSFSRRNLKIDPWASRSQKLLTVGTTLKRAQLVPSLLGDGPGQGPRQSCTGSRASSSAIRGTSEVNPAAQQGVAALKGFSTCFSCKY